MGSLLPTRWTPNPPLGTQIAIEIGRRTEKRKERERETEKQRDRGKIERAQKENNPEKGIVS